MQTNQVEVAQTILQQLGGRRFKIMTGARDLFATDKGLRFKLPSSGGFTRRGINFVEIELAPNDTYTLKFSRVQRFNLTRVNTLYDVYAESLQGIFTQETGLDTHL